MTKSAQGNAKNSSIGPDGVNRACPDARDLRSSDVLDEDREHSGIRVARTLPREPRKLRPAARMRFRRGSPECVLTLEAPASEDWMPELYRLLLSSHVQVVRVHAQVVGEVIVHELDVVEFDGSPLPEERWLGVQSTAIAYLGDRVMMLSAQATPANAPDAYAPELLGSAE